MGSFHHSLAELGWTCVFACDKNATCRSVYSQLYNMPVAGAIEDIDEHALPSYDVLCAGFPCQPFSIIGKRNGFEDKRGNAFEHIMRIVRATEPKVVLLENVRGLLNHQKGQTIAIIKDQLADAGYQFDVRLLDCSDYGIPQMRKRVFIVAARGGISPNMDWITSIPASIKPYKLDHFLNRGRLVKDRVKFLNKKKAYTIRCGGRRSPVDSKHNWDGYVTKPAYGVKESTVYRLTIADCLKLQGYQEGLFENIRIPDSEKYRLVGNTIPTNLTLVVGKYVEHMLLTQ